jgi:hypothetical protein
MSSGHGWAYTLMADVDDIVNFGVNYNLRQVVFTTTSVDNGAVVNTGNCTLGSSKSPTSQTFTATDVAADMECSFTCNAVTGTSLTIQYQ